MAVNSAWVLSESETDLNLFLIPIHRFQFPFLHGLCGYILRSIVPIDGYLLREMNCTESSRVNLFERILRRIA